MVAMASFLIALWVGIAVLRFVLDTRPYTPDPA